MQNETVHEPVLLNETIEALELTQPKKLVDEKGVLAAKEEFVANTRSDEFVYLDGTLGGAGHATAVAQTFLSNAAGGAATNGKSQELSNRNLQRFILLGLDRDETALMRDRPRLEEVLRKFSDISEPPARLILENEDFRNLDVALDKNGLTKVDRILLDLGLSSDELETSGKGFTFLKDEPLLMTMGDPSKHSFTAKDIVNGWDEEVIANVIFGYAEERFARRIAKAIVSYRLKKQIETSGELAEIIKSSVPAFYRRGKIHPATKTFQALRIAVNDELGSLKEALSKGFERLKPGGIMAVISFHSLEDRIVKEFFREASKPHKPIKLIKPSPEEIARNPRSRSAKLRILKKPI